MRKMLVAAALACVLCPVAWGDDSDRQEALRRGMTVDAVQLEHANARISVLEKQIADLKAALARSTATTAPAVQTDAEAYLAWAKTHGGQIPQKDMAEFQKHVVGLTLEQALSAMEACHAIMPGQQPAVHSTSAAGQSLSIATGENWSFELVELSTDGKVITSARFSATERRLPPAVAH